MELLSPCGNFESLIGVINAGADAVYLAGNKYGARAYADNFNDDEIIKAIKYAHLNNVRVYLTVNTLIKEKEFEDVINYITPFYNAGLDACIVQDLGLISIFNDYFPQMELHISTQAYSTGINSIKLFKEYGATRVVLAREMSLEEIKEIKEKTDVEIEAFIHGAMCYSYSGQCLFSSCLGGRSGNRGRCAGPCRLNYECNNKNGYLLSMKDQCTLSILPQLIKAGIDSFKIEGRMKRPEYAAFVTSIYRKYIDLYLKNPKSYSIDSKDLKNLNKFYMRSEIGTGYYNIYNGPEMLTLSNPAYEKTDDNLLNEANEQFLKTIKKIPVTINAYCNVGQPLTVTIICKDITEVYEGKIIEESINRPTDQLNIKNQLAKLGDTFFCLEDIYITTDNNCFIPIKDLNEARRELITRLENSLLVHNKKEKFYLQKRIVKKSIKEDNLQLPIISVSTEEQLKTIINIDNIKCYLTINDELFSKSAEALKNIDKNQYKILINLPFVTRKNNLDLLNKYKTGYINIVDGFIINNPEELYIFRGNNKLLFSGPGLYSWNNKAIEFLNTYTDNIIYPFELSKHELQDINFGKGYLMVYGKIPLMQTANCIEKTTLGCKKNTGNKISYIKDRKNTDFLIIRNCTSCYNTIYNSVPTSLHNENIGSANLYISFTDESKDDVINILDTLFGNKKFNSNSFTKGYWKRGVE